MGDGRVDPTVRDRARAGTERGKTAARVAATKGGDLGRSAAARGADLGRSAASKGAQVRRTMARLDVPWARCGLARRVREAFLSLILGPAMKFYMRFRTHGRERFADIDAPVILVSNHSSHLDTPTILRALPRRWRDRTAVAAAADYFYKKRRTAAFVALIFNTVPIQRRGGGLGEGATDHVDRLIDQRWNLLMYPEGTRSRDGRIGKLRSGAAAIAAQHGIPIVPIYVTGTHQAMPPGRNWPKRIPGRFLSHRHKVDVHFGPPIQAAAGEPGHDVMARVMSFYEGLGAEPRNPRHDAPANGNGNGAAPRAPRQPVAPGA
jgi:1-acyl-sn-glycerol-3-phosphate acyltransferase